MATTSNQQDSAFSPWRAALYVTLAVFGATLLLVAGGGWILAPLPSEVKLPLLIVVAVVALLGSISLVVIAFGIFRLVNRDQALGLPDGSVRAIIALMLIVLFAAMTVFLIARLDMARADDPSVDVTKQVLTVLGTLVTAVASFYFGSKSVSDALAKKPDEKRGDDEKPTPSDTNPQKPEPQKPEPQKPEPQKPEPQKPVNTNPSDIKTNQKNDEPETDEALEDVAVQNLTNEIARLTAERNRAILKARATEHPVSKLKAG